MRVVGAGRVMDGWWVEQTGFGPASKLDDLRQARSEAVAHAEALRAPGGECLTAPARPPFPAFDRRIVETLLL